MAKKSDTPNSISFAPGFSCAVWIPIPITLIEKVDHLGMIGCNDHQHDHVRLHFVNPTTEEGKALTDLLKQIIGSDETRLLRPATTHPMPFDGQQSVLSWGGWRPPPIHPPPIHLPPIHLPDPSKPLRCAACVAGWATVAAGIAAYAAATGGIGIVALGDWIVATYGVSTTTALAGASAAVAGGSAAAIAYAMCPDCH